MMLRVLIFAFMFLCYSAAALAGKTEREKGRKLDSVQVLNALLNGVEFEVQNFKISRMSVDSLFVRDDGIENRGSNQVRTLFIRAGGVDGHVKSFISANSKGSKVSIKFELVSSKFGRVIPTKAQLASNFDCGDLIDLKLKKGPLVSYLASLVIPLFCNRILNSLDSAIGLIGENVLVDMAGTRLEQPSSVNIVIPPAEAQLKEKLKDNFQFYDEATAEDVIKYLSNQTVFSPLVAGVLIELQDLADAFRENSAPALQDSLNDLVFLFLGSELEIPSSIIDTIVNLDIGNLAAPILEGLLSGSISVGAVVNQALALTTFKLPTVEDLEKFFAGLPPAINELFTIVGVDDFVISVAKFFGVKPAESTESLRILLEQADRRDLQLDAFSGLLDGLLGTTIGDVLPNVPPGVLADFLIFFGEDTTLIDAAKELFEIAKGISKEFEGGISLRLNRPPPAAFLEGVKVVAIFVPVIQEYVDLIENSPDGTLQELATNLTFAFPVNQIGTVFLQAFSLDLDTNLHFFEGDYGYQGQSSFVLPGFEATGTTMTLGFKLNVEKDGVSSFEDVLFVSMDDFKFSTQEVLSFAVDYAPFFSFGLENLQSLPSALNVISDMFGCYSSGVGLALSAEKTESDLAASFSSQNNVIGGFGNDLINIGLEMYAPAAPTILEKIMANLTKDMNFTFFGGVPDACSRNPEVVSVPTNGGGFTGGEEPPSPGTGGDSGGGGTKGLTGSLDTATVYSTLSVLTAVMIGSLLYKLYKPTPAQAAVCMEGEVEAVSEPFPRETADVGEKSAPSPNSANIDEEDDIEV